MALNFPNNPSVNDTVELAGKTYQYDGVKWRMVYVVTPTPPTAQALAPTITEVSTTQTSITFTITNNDASTAVILYELDDTTPDANSIELAAAATSSNLTISGLSLGLNTLYATANVTGKVKSNVTEREFTLVNPFTVATGGTTAEYDNSGKRFRSHTFNSSGTFTVTNVGETNQDRNKVDYLIIAGGAGSNGYGSGGGGAGGYRTTNGTSGANSSAESKVVVTAQGYTITIGAGGAAAPSANADYSALANPGNASSALGISTVGGGGSGGDNGGSGFTGGSGGGAGVSGGAPRTGGSGTANQGFAGGNAIISNGGGGGGAGELGQAGSSGVNGKGGDGLSNTLRTGSGETRGGGGGASGRASSGNGGAGGAGGGGKGSDTGSTYNATAGAVNTGGGGGGARGFNNGNADGGQAGGSGLVVIRYEIAPSV